jgi:uncharacterized membrane protein
MEWERMRRWHRNADPARPPGPAAAELDRRDGTRPSVPSTGSRDGDPAAPGRTAAGTGAPAAAEGKAALGRRPGTTKVRVGGSGLLGIRPTPVNVKLVYAAYLASLAIPFLAILAVFVAHQALRANPTTWLATHYVFQIRTFWFGLAANVVAYALTFAGVGVLIFPLIAIWVVARSVKGLIRVAHRSPVENPNSIFV